MLVYYKQKSEYFLSKQDYKKSTEFYLKALNIHENILGISTLKTAIYHDDIALLFKQQKKPYKAIEFTKNALKIREKILGKKHLLVAKSYNELATYYDDLKRYSKALEYTQKAFIINIKLYGSINIITLKSYENIAKYYLLEEKKKKALIYFKKVLNLQSKIYKKNENINSIATIKKLADLYNQLEIFDRALLYYKKILHFETKQKIDLEDFLVAVYNIGTIYYSLGFFSKSLKYYNQALDIREQTSETQNIDISMIYNSIGVLYDSLGETDKALKYYFKVVDINTEEIKIAFVYNNIGAVYCDKKKFDLSLEYLQKALKISKSILGDEHALTTASYNNTAKLYHGFNEYTLALKYYQTALTNRKNNSELNNTATAVSYNNMGIYYYDIKDYNISLDYFQKALEIRKTIFGEQHSSVASVYINMARVYYDLKEYYNAYTLFKKALNIKIFLTHDLFNDFNVTLVKSFSKKQENYRLIKEYLNSAIFYIKFTPSTNKKNLTNEVYNIWLNNQIDFQDNEVFLSIISNSTTDSHLKEQIELLKIKKYYLAKLLNNTSTQNEERIIKTQNEISDIEIYLAKNINKFKESQNLKNIDASMIYKDLSTDSVFIDCIYGEKNIYIFIIHHNGNIDFIEINKKDSSLISKNILEFRKNIDNTASAVKSKENPITKELFQNKKDEIENILHEIYQVLFQKYIAHNIKGIKRLIISPDGLLHQLPFEAFYDGNNYLLHTFDITYIASGREFIRLNKFNKLSSTNNNTISAFANPNYDNTIELKERDGKNNNFRTIKKFEKCHPLPKTKTEVLAIKNIFPSIKIFTELNANEENLQSISNSKILHIATHGIVVENKDEREPLLKCALALTGYNTSIANKNDYGIFTGLKIVSLNLKNTDLVVLSTCESAKGQSDSTEGVASLSRAFMMAGANTTIASLWEANDEYSKDFFTQYYKKLSISSDYNKAFKETQLESFNNLQNKGLDHPLFWACFCFFGTGE